MTPPCRYREIPQATHVTKRFIHVELSKEAAARYPKTKIKARSGYVVPKP